MKRKPKPDIKHSPDGWNFEKVNLLINDINETLRKAEVTFSEEQYILSWFQSNLIYEMGILSSKTFTQSKNFIDILQQLNTIPVNHEQFKGNYIQ